MRYYNNEEKNLIYQYSRIKTIYMVTRIRIKILFRNFLQQSLRKIPHLSLQQYKLIMRHKKIKNLLLLQIILTQLSVHQNKTVIQH